MNRVTRLSLSSLLFLALVAGGVAGWWWYSRPVLKLYVWDGYLPEDVLLEFSAKYQVRIKLRTYQKNAEMLARVKVSWDEFDVIMPSNYLIAPMRQQNLLTKFARREITNFNLLAPEFQRGHEGEEANVAFAVPYMMNYAGIGYRKNAVANPPKTWREFFSPSTAQVHGRRMMMLDEAREVIGLVLISLGHSPNTRDPTQLSAAGDVLNALGSDGVPRLVLGEGRTLLESGEGVLLQTWSPEVALAQEAVSDVGYVMPEDGSLLTVDTLAIPRSSSRQDLAKVFINYLLEPRVAARVTAHSHYANTLNSRVDHVSDHLKRSPSYAEPPPEKRFHLTDVGDAQHLYDAVWARFKGRNKRE